VPWRIKLANSERNIHSTLHTRSKETSQV